VAVVVLELAINQQGEQEDQLVVTELQVQVAIVLVAMVAVVVAVVHAFVGMGQLYLQPIVHLQS
jgi:hypothetical protein